MATLFLIFIIVPLVEIYLLIEIGSWLGAGTTIFLVVFTAVLGAALVRTQGFSTLRRIQEQLAQNQVPAVEIMEGMALFAAGALLLTPGFFTDAAGFILLTPPLRRFIIRRIIERGSANFNGSIHGQAAEHRQSRVIDIDHKKID